MTVAWTIFTFLISAAIVVAAAVKLAEYGDVIATRTRLGGVFVGTIFLAGATSLPEMVTAISSFAADVPNLAAGNFFGSNMVNMLLLAIVDMINYQVPLLRRVAITHTLTAALSTTLMILSAFFILADIDILIGWVGLDSLILIVIYFGGVWLIQEEGQLAAGTTSQIAVAVSEDFPSLQRGVLGFSAAAAILVLVVPQLVKASSDLATITGLGTSFVGTAFLSVITSLPELLAALAAARIGALDLAAGNLFGSSVFNMLGVGLADIFYVHGRFLGAIDPNFALVGLLGLLLTNMALMGNLARIERKVLFIELDALGIILVYLVGMYFLFVRGIGL